MTMLKCTWQKTVALSACAITCGVMACSDQGSNEEASLAGQELSDGSEIRALYSAGNISAYLQELVGAGPRIAGTASERAASLLIENRFKGFGLETAVEEYEVTLAWKDNCGSSVKLGGGTLSPIKALPLTFSPPARITARVIPAGLGFPDQFPAGERDYLALVKRGAIPFAFKAQFAFEAGAAGVIVYNDRSTEGPLPGFNAATTKLPIAMIPLEAGEKILALAQAKPVTATLFVNTKRETAPSRNVVATLAGLDPESRPLYVTAHYDSSAMAIKEKMDNSHYVCPRTYDSRTNRMSPGANDNASGTAALLEAARVLSTRAPLRSTVKFIAFSGEEVGLSGSLAYALAHLGELVPPSDPEPSPALGVINMDMVGVGNNLIFGNSPGWAPPDVVCLGIAKADAMGIVAYPGNMPQTSDHAAFEWCGVPTMAMTRMIGEEPHPIYFTDDPNYHQPTDTMDKVAAGLIETAGELATGVAEDLANGLTAACP